MNQGLTMNLIASAGHGHHEVSSGVTLCFAFILLCMIITLALEEKLHAKKSVIVGVYAIICLFLGALLGLLPFGPVINVFNEKLNLPVYIPAVDWSVIAIIMGSALFVDITSKSGLFSWIAIKLTKASGGDPFMLLVYYGLMTVIFSAVLNNVTAMIIVGSLTAVSLGKLDRNDKLLGFLLVEGLLTNIGGLLTLISSVPNIIVGTSAGISFVKFFVIAGPYVVVATAVTLFFGAKWFKIERLATEEERQAAKAQVSSFDENDGIASEGFFWFSAGIFLLFIITIASINRHVIELAQIRHALAGSWCHCAEDALLIP